MTAHRARPYGAMIDRAFASADPRERILLRWLYRRFREGQYATPFSARATVAAYTMKAEGRTMRRDDAPPHGIPRPIIMPDWDTLTARPSQCEAQSCDLRVDTVDFRLWTARTGLDEGEPYERTVYVELLTDTRWVNLGHYDGDEPPRGLPGVTPHAFRGELP